MPLLHRKPFVANLPPKISSPNDEVFFCPLTKEVFTNYEQFFERTILCNSLVWSCAITERGNMTYQEALDHEENARKKLAKFPKDLQKPMLLLAKLMCLSRIEALNDAIFSFIKKRYFIGEQLEVRVKSNKYESCRVLDVFPIKPIPDGGMNGHANGEASSDDDEDDDNKPLSKFVKAKHLEPEEVSYQVKILGASLTPIRTVPWTALRRKLRREQCKIFLKRTCIQDSSGNRTYSIKPEVAEKLGMASLKWEDVFAGPTPTFSTQSPKVKRSTEKTANKSGKKTVSEPKPAKDETLLNEMRKQKEMKMEMKKRELEQAKKQKQMLLEKRRQEFLERKEKMERMREVKRRLAEFQKQWSKQRDDLECDDLKDIPQPREITTRIPPRLFGDVLSLMEFIVVFENVFDWKVDFPRGVTLGIFEKALMDQNQDGPMCDLLFFFLSNLFRTQTEEEGENLYMLESSDIAASRKAASNRSLENLVAFATLASTWPEKYQGCSLDKLELDSSTVSEILRMYLLTSSARVPQDSRLWRTQQRGAYGPSDDTPLKMCLDNPGLIEKLSKTSIYNFSPDEKMEILQCLCNHLLSFVTTRDFIDDITEKYWSSLFDYRVDKRSEKKRAKEFIIERTKFKYGQMKTPQQNESEVENKEVVENLRMMTVEQRLEHLRGMDEEERVAKEAWEFREKKHLKDIALYRRFKIVPLGEDRYFRRYWALNSVPGLLVEEYPDPSLTEDLLAVKVKQKAAWGDGVTPTKAPNNSTATPINSGDLESAPPGKVNSDALDAANGELSPNLKLEKMTGDTGLQRDSVDSSQAEFVAGCQGKSYRWMIYTEEGEIENVLTSLNRRGFREAKLAESLSNARAEIFARLKKCPLNELFQKQREDDRKAKAMSWKVAIELALRDQVLDLESRIFEGTLGGIKEEDGFDWVNRVSNATTYPQELSDRLLESVVPIGVAKAEGDILDECDTEEEMSKLRKREKLVAPPSLVFPMGSAEGGDEEMEQDGETAQTEMDLAHAQKVRDLSLALLQVERGIDKKYLKAPLGYSVDIARRKTRSKGPAEDDEEEIMRRKKASATYLRRWENSLVNCTSFSQISLHLSTLNKCIIWARSVLNASCRICHRRGDADKMLLCDSCDRGHHMYCLKPPLKNVPTGDWFCPQCKPIHSHRMSPRRVRATSFTQEASSEDEEEEEADDTEEEDDDNMEEEEVEEDEEQETEEENESSQDEEEEEAPVKRGIRLPSRPTRKSGRERKAKKPSPNVQRTSGRTSGRDSNRASTDNGRKSRSSNSFKRGASNDDEDYQGSSSRRRSAGVWKELNSCQEILKEMIQHKDGWPFVMPVSKKQVPDYYEVISRPMDFASMQNKLKNVEYSDPSEFIEDAKLVFSNCLLYNMPRSVHAKAALQLENYFEKRMKETGLDKYKDVIDGTHPPTKKRKS